MKRILIIASSTGNTAPGKVFSKYISLLKQNDFVQIDVISNDSDLDATYIKLKNIHPRVRKLSVSFLGYDIFDYLNARKIINNFDQKYDVVFSMMSANHFFPLYFGYLYKKKFKEVHWVNYSVDAIPAPIGWGLSKSYSNGLIKMIQKFMAKVDHLYFSNNVMLNYQLKVLGGSFKGSSGVLYTLPHNDFINLPYKENNRPFTLLYTGGIYQARKVDQLLLALEKLVLEGIDIRLNFVGTNPEAVNLKVVNQETASKVNFFGYTSDLLPFYQEADLLIDIDAAIENDVFISSKFFNYLTINRNILCITGSNSPVNQLVRDKNISDIFFSRHYSDDIARVLFSIYSNSPMLINRNVEIISNKYISNVLNFEDWSE